MPRSFLVKKKDGKVRRVSEKDGDGALDCPSACGSVSPDNSRPGTPDSVASSSSSFVDVIGYGDDEDNASDDENAQEGGRTDGSQASTPPPLPGPSALPLPLPLSQAGGQHTHVSLWSGAVPRDPVNGAISPAFRSIPLTSSRTAGPLSSPIPTSGDRKQVPSSDQCVNPNPDATDQYKLNTKCIWSNVTASLLSHNAPPSSSPPIYRLSDDEIAGFDSSSEPAAHGVNHNNPMHLPPRVKTERGDSGFGMSQFTESSDGERTTNGVDETPNSMKNDSELSHNGSIKSMEGFIKSPGYVVNGGEETRLQRWDSAQGPKSAENDHIPPYKLRPSELGHSDLYSHRTKFFDSLLAISCPDFGESPRPVAQRGMSLPSLQNNIHRSEQASMNGGSSDNLGHFNKGRAFSMYERSLVDRSYPPMLLLPDDSISRSAGTPHSLPTDCKRPTAVLPSRPRSAPGAGEHSIVARRTRSPVNFSPEKGPSIQRAFSTSSANDPGMRSDREVLFSPMSATEQGPPPTYALRVDPRAADEEEDGMTSQPGVRTHSVRRIIPSPNGSHGRSPSPRCSPCGISNHSGQQPPGTSLHVRIEGGRLELRGRSMDESLSEEAISEEISSASSSVTSSPEAKDMSSVYIRRFSSSPPALSPPECRLIKNGDNEPSCSTPQQVLASPSPPLPPPPPPPPRINEPFTWSTKLPHMISPRNYLDLSFRRLQQLHYHATKENMKYAAFRTPYSSPPYSPADSAYGRPFLPSLHHPYLPIHTASERYFSRKRLPHLTYEQKTMDERLKAKYSARTFFEHLPSSFERGQPTLSPRKDRDIPPGWCASGTQVASMDLSKMTAKDGGDVAPRFTCDGCGKSYSTFSGLSKHKQFHCTTHVKKQFSCKYCDKTYVSLGALKMHIRTHTLPCKCPLCGKAFSRPWLLQGHIRTHTGEKPFKCQHCARAFADRSNLRAHLQTHTDIKKYNCKSCAKTFSRMSLLLKHEDGGCASGV